MRREGVDGQSRVQEWRSMIQKQISLKGDIKHRDKTILGLQVTHRIKEQVRSRRERWEARLWQKSGKE